MEWTLTEQGIVLQTAACNAAVRDRLEMMCLAEQAQDCGGAVLIPHDVLAALPDEDGGLFGLPERNPYHIAVYADGDLGHADLRYRINVLRPDGAIFVNPVFQGALLTIDSTQTYRMSSAEYRLVRTAEESNRMIGGVERAELTAFNCLNLAEIQHCARTAQARLEETLSERNNRIIVPEQLDVQIAEDGSVAPVLLTRDDSGRSTPVDTETFAALFGRQRRVSALYRGNDEQRTRYVCRPAVQDGLTQIKAVSKVRREDVERFRAQPRELFAGEVFSFAINEGDAGAEERCSAEDNEASDENWIAEEGQFVDDFYSDRVTGLATIQKGVYYGSGHRTDWLADEGEAEAGEILSDSVEEAECSPSAAENMMDAVREDTAPLELDTEVFDDAPVPPQTADERPQPIALQALDIKANFDIVDYAPTMERRSGALAADALNAEVKLLDYQNAGVAWMFEAWQRGYKGVLLADDMGLGKTLQTLAFAAQLRKGVPADADAQKPILIVAPIALLKNWQNEYRKFIADGVFRDIMPLHGSSLRDYETGESTPNGKKKLEIRLHADAIALTTYETLRDYQFSFAEVNWGIIVVDEAQKMKNPSTGVTKAIKAMKYDYAVCLSGTPVENSWVDLWSIMDFVQPGQLGVLKEFRDRYIAPLRQMSDAPHEIETLGKHLKDALNPIFMRRMKRDNLEGLPKKTVCPRPAQMPTYQKERYQAVIGAGRRGEIQPLVMLARLRNISLHPDLGTKTPAAFYAMPVEIVIGQSARLIELFAILEDVRSRGEKALIFLVSKDMQLILKHLLQEKFGIRVHPPVNGDMNGTARQKIVDQFNAAVGFGVLILSPEAAGVGFTITAANHVIHLSRTWNPAKEDQATDRVYRIGQKKEVFVYLPMACHADLGTGGSFDEKLDELLAYKRRLSANVLFPTSDTSKDGLELAQKLTTGKAMHTQDYYWSMDDVDTVKGDVFEQLVADLYRGMEIYQEVTRTPHSHDNGADVVAIAEDGKHGLLIQCKHVEDVRKTMEKRAVQEIAAAVSFYEQAHRGVSFTPVALTNAEHFSDGAKALAAANGVNLIARHELNELLQDYPLVRSY